MVNTKVKNVQKSLSTLQLEDDSGGCLDIESLSRIYLFGIVSGFVHRISNATSNWANFHTSWLNAEKILSDNQYPYVFVVSYCVRSDPEKTSQHHSKKKS